MKLKIYNEGGKVRVTKADLDGSETTLFSGVSDGGSAVIDISSSISFELEDAMGPVSALYASVPDTPEELEAMYLLHKTNKPQN